MTRFVTNLATAAVASFLLIGAASAQTPAADPKAAPAATSKMAPADSKTDAKVAKPRTEASLECSKQADTKGLHGEARRKFRSECKKGAKAN